MFYDHDPGPCEPADHTAGPLTELYNRAVRYADNVTVEFSGGFILPDSSVFEYPDGSLLGFHDGGYTATFGAVLRSRDSLQLAQAVLQHKEARQWMTVWKTQRQSHPVFCHEWN